MDVSKVKDHCHITGKYRGSAYRDINITYYINIILTPNSFFFHNVKDYDLYNIFKGPRKFD